MKFLAIMAIAILASACFDVAEGRIEEERRVGSAASQDARIQVTGGLATVREFSADEASLWGNAPVLDIALSRTRDSFDLELINAMPDAELEIIDGVQNASPIDAPRDTVKRWRLEGVAESAAIRIAPADAEPAAPFRFIIYADVQDRIDDIQDMYARMREVPGVRFALISGDLTESGSEEQMQRFQREMRTMTFPAFATLGNHELGSGDVYFYDYFGRGNSSFVFKTMRFTMLDSASATIAPTAWDWFEQWLEDARDQTHLVMMHIPPRDPNGFRNGAFASRAEGSNSILRMAEANVDMAVYGHVHTYYAYTHAGVPAYITGGGGAIPQRFDGIGRHFLVVDVDPSTQAIETSVIRVFPE